MPILVVLVDDHSVVRRGIRSYLESFPDIAIGGEAASGEELVSQIENWLPDVVVMDMMMPGGMDGVEATRQIRAISPHTQVVVLTAHTGDERVVAALRAGAIGYVRKDAEPELLLSAIRAASRGQSLLDPAVAGSVLQDLIDESPIRDQLTEREMEVLRLLAHGHTNKEIADELIIGEETVKTHVGNILSKLHSAHRIQAVVQALKKGMISLDEIDL